MRFRFESWHPSFTVYSAVWSARPVWVREAVGSNPTRRIRGVRLAGLRHLVLSQKIMGSNPIHPIRRSRSNWLGHRFFKPNGAGSNPACAFHALVVELAYTLVLGTSAFGIEGSTPSECISVTSPIGRGIRLKPGVVWVRIPGGASSACSSAERVLPCEGRSHWFESSQAHIGRWSSG